jgi:cobalt-zinc-cadmium efflux system protein
MAAGHDHGADKHAVNRRRLAIAFAITSTILLAEIVGALVTNSLALLVDAAHMLTDAAGLGTAPRPAKPRSCSRWAYS